jgi:hypothetical protein
VVFTDIPHADLSSAEETAASPESLCQAGIEFTFASCKVFGKNFRFNTLLEISE